MGPSDTPFVTQTPLFRHSGFASSPPSTVSLKLNANSPAHPAPLPTQIASLFFSQISESYLGLTACMIFVNFSRWSQDIPPVSSTGRRIRTDGIPLVYYQIMKEHLNLLDSLIRVSSQPFSRHRHDILTRPKWRSYFSPTPTELPNRQ